MKVLIVDDEPSVLSSTERLLQDMGFETAGVAESTQIEDAMRSHRPDVVLQDLRMPGLDIDELLDRLRADRELCAIPIILFSAGIDLDDVQGRVQAAGVLEKPFKPHEAVAAISAAQET